MGRPIPSPRGKRASLCTCGAHFAESNPRRARTSARDTAGKRALVISAPCHSDAAAANAAARAASSAARAIEHQDDTSEQLAYFQVPAIPALESDLPSL